MDSVKVDIVDVLQTKQKNTREYYLLLGLAEITTPEEFAQLTDGLELDAGNVEKVKQYNLFRQGDAGQQSSLAKVFMTKGDSAQKRAAVDYLIKNKEAESLARNWQAGDAYVRGAVKRAGYELQVTDTGAELSERPHRHEETPAWWIGLVLAGLLLAGVWRQRKKAS